MFPDQFNELVYVASIHQGYHYHVDETILNQLCTGQNVAFHSVGLVKDIRITSQLNFYGNDEQSYGILGRGWAKSHVENIHKDISSTFFLLITYQMSLHFSFTYPHIAS